MIYVYSMYMGTDEYEVGDTDKRPWGKYTVTAVTKDVTNVTRCEKEIVVYPNNILSLQSHKCRAEVWTVIDGVLTVIIDGRVLELYEGDTVTVPINALHCMANLQKPLTDNTPVVIVKEIQTGICKEADIVRYADAYGRGTGNFAERADVDKSMDLYMGLLDKIKNGDGQ